MNSTMSSTKKIGYGKFVYFIIFSLMIIGIYYFHQYYNTHTPSSGRTSYSSNVHSWQLVYTYVVEGEGIDGDTLIRTAQFYTDYRYKDRLVIQTEPQGQLLYIQVGPKIQKVTGRYEGTNENPNDQLGRYVYAAASVGVKIKTEIYRKM